VEVLPDSHPDVIEKALYEVDHVAQVFSAVDDALHHGKVFDLIHDHCGFTAVAMADRIDVPVVHTLHGPFTDDTAEFYLRHGGKAHLVAISRAQRESAPEDLVIDGTVPNPIDVRHWPFRERKGDHLLWVGRMTPEKGPHRAIAAARSAGVRLVLAGPVQAGQEDFFNDEVSPLIDDEDVQYVGEVGGDQKMELFADARALLMPIRWREPFGMVMVEALACGTPVIAFPEGAATEIVEHGRNGYLVEDESGMADAIGMIDQIDPAVCRASVADRFDVDTVVAGYERIYRRVLAQHAQAPARPALAPVPLQDDSPRAG
jgi:glycosyltransferase involved in cell wall biosynthesis